MNKDIAERWCARLRSGEVKQTQGHLGDENGSRCCLGVLCDLAVEDGIIPAPVLRVGAATGMRRMKYGGVSSAVSVLPDVVRRWAGMARASGELRNGGSLVIENDSGKPFTAIADIIEAHVDTL